MGVKRREPARDRCPAKPPLRTRPLLTARQAGDLQRIFKVLANDSRLRLLHALIRVDELCVSELARKAGMTRQAVSNQLRRLSDLAIVGSRREGLRIYYRVADPCVAQLIEQGLCLMEDSRDRVEGAGMGHLLTGTGG